MLIQQRRRMRFLYLFGDLATLVVTSVLAMFTRFWFDYSDIVVSWYVLAFILIISIVVILNFFYGLYDLRIKSFASQIQPIINSLMYGFMSFVLFTFFVREITFSRLTFIYYGIYCLIGMLAVRLLVNRFIKEQMKKGIGTQKTLAVGEISGLVEVVAYLVEHPEFGYNVFGAVTTDCASFPRSEVTVLADINGFERILQEYKPDVVLLGIGKYELEKKIINYCERHYTDVLMIPDIINLFSSPVGISQIASIPLIRFKESPLVGVQGRFKRLFDTVSSLIGIIVLCPLFIVVGLTIKIVSPGGPVLFSHNRLGRNGRIIKVYKFRSMVPNATKVLQEILLRDTAMAKEFREEFKLKEDPRVFPFGRFLRKTSLDELPQLINVIKGEMALVGPRPIVPEELENYGDYAKFLLRVPPGITGLWQVSGRNDISYKERTKLDMYYINNWSFWLDIMILVRTIPSVLARKGAY